MTGSVGIAPTAASVAQPGGPVSSAGRVVSVDLRLPADLHRLAKIAAATASVTLAGYILGALATRLGVEPTLTGASPNGVRPQEPRR